MIVNRRSFLSLLGVSPLGFNLFGTIENSPIFGKPFKTVYKVTNYRDYSAANIQDFLKVHYKIGEITSKPPEYGPLFTFEKYEDALDYLSSRSEKIFKCRSKQYKKGFMLQGNNQACSRRVQHFWEDPYKHSSVNVSYIDEFANDKYSVIFCDTLEVLERIK